MARSMGRYFMAALLVIALGPTGADAARTLLSDLIARAPAEAGQKETMSALALEACIHRARELDTIGVAIDYQIAAIDRDVAEGIFLQNQLNAELSTLNDYSEKDMENLQRRVIRHEDLARKFQSEFPDYQQKQRAYEAAVAEFERNCAGRFSGDDLKTIKRKLDVK